MFNLGLGDHGGKKAGSQASGDLHGSHVETKGEPTARQPTPQSHTAKNTRGEKPSVIQTESNQLSLLILPQIHLSKPFATFTSAGHLADQRPPRQLGSN